MDEIVKAITNNVNELAQLALRIRTKQGVGSDSDETIISRSLIDMNVLHTALSNATMQNNELKLALDNISHKLSLAKDLVLELNNANNDPSPNELRFCVQEILLKAKKAELY